jgi:hypothetical protein
MSESQDASAGKEDAAAGKALVGVYLPFLINKSMAVTPDTLGSLYTGSERAQQGAFPLGLGGQFHSGVHLVVERNTPILATSQGEVVAARLGVAAGAHPWGDTGFVVLRHAVGDKTVFSLFLHLQREPLNPARTTAGWLRRVLLGDTPITATDKWKVIADCPTWTEEDSGDFLPANLGKGETLKAGSYDEQDWIGRKDRGIFVKLDGKWVYSGTGGEDSDSSVTQLSGWRDFDLDERAKESTIVAALRDGKTALFDADKTDDGKHRWTVKAGEAIGAAGSFLGVPVIHWSIFSKDPVFPTGELPKKEFATGAEVKLADLALTEDAGDTEQTRKLIEALDPDKKTIGKMPGSIPMAGEVELFYRTPAECWRSRYLAVKALPELALDVDKFLGQDRAKSHTDAERAEFKTNAQPFAFWSDLAGADDFPADQATFVHPATALRMMSGAPDPGLHLRLRLLDMTGQPLKEETVFIDVEKTPVPVETDDKGLVDLEIDDNPPKEGAIAFATSHKKRTLKLDPLDDAGTATGDRDRLNNLGYFAGFIGSEDPDDRNLKWAIEEFQCNTFVMTLPEADRPAAVGKFVTGVMDDQTKAKLLEAHGS